MLVYQRYLVRTLAQLFGLAVNKDGTLAPLPPSQQPAELAAVVDGQNLQLALAGQEMTTLLGQYATLASLYQQAQTELVQVTARAAAVQQDTATMGTHLVTLQGLADDYTQALGASLADRQALHAAADEQAVQLALCAQLLDALEADFGVLTGLYQQVQTELVQVKARAAAQQTTLDGQAQQLSGLQQTVQEHSVGLSVAAQDRRTLHATDQSQQSQLDTQVVQLALARQELATLQGQYSTAVNLLQQVQTELVQTKAQVAAAQGTLTTQGATLAAQASTLSSQATTLAALQARPSHTYKRGADAPVSGKLWIATSTTVSGGAASFPLPTSYFAELHGAWATVLRNTADPKLYPICFVQTPLTPLPTALVVQVGESKTTGVLVLNTSVEGLEPAPAGLVVSLLVAGV